MRVAVSVIVGVNDAVGIAVAVLVINGVGVLVADPPVATAEVVGTGVLVDVGFGLLVGGGGG